jgi:Kef-type K+ transport system membrane component KefB
MRHRLVWLLVLLLAMAACFAHADPAHAGQSATPGHGDPAAHVVLGLALVLIAAKLGGALAVRLGQAAVLGELVAGVAVGNLDLLGVNAFDWLAADSGLDLLARIGVLVLLFEVGLESTVRQMMQVGVSSLLVATLGVAAPFALGWFVSSWLLPDAGHYTHLFIGATLTATSVGITARVLRDLGWSTSGEARIILGAAVIDDVMGLVILAVVTGMIAGANGAGGGLSAGGVALILGKSLGFLLGALVLGAVLSPRVFRVSSRLGGTGVLLAVSLTFCFLLSWAADAMGLASIVGAFAAGLVLERVHYRDFTDRGEHQLEELIHPISSILVPVFFVIMGVRTDLRAFGDPNIIGLAGALTVAAIAGKQLCSLGVTMKGIDRVAVGLGMIPRGEVGLIFANIGLGLSVKGKAIVDGSEFAAVVVMVVLTTMMTPPLLKWRLARNPKHV